MPFISSEYLQNLTPEKRDSFLRTHLRLGYHPDTGDTFFVPDNDRFAGTYVIGVPGVGKSSGLENMVSFDHKANNSLIVVDVQGDFINALIAESPPHRLAHTYLLDIEDTAFPIGVNLFGQETATGELVQTQRVERILHIFDVLWPEVLSQQGLPRYLRAATLVLLANPGSTLVDMYRLLLDETFRNNAIQQVSDEWVLQFWKTQYNDLKEADRLKRVQPLIARLESLFMGRSIVRNIVGQRVNTINFRAAIENHEVILIRLPLKTLGQDARLIGTILLSQIHTAVFSFADIPQEQRPGVSLYLDEFQTLSTPDIGELFFEGRKYGVKLTVAHQTRGQLPKYLQEATMSARTKICFQTIPEDGAEMARVFPAQEQTIKPEDIEAHPVEHLLTYGSDDPAIKVFIEKYLRPLQGHRRGNRVEIDRFSFDWISNERRDNPRVPDPTPYLDNLLYQAMRSGNAEMRIPPFAVTGFAKCGYDFFMQAGGEYGLRPDNELLSPGVLFPRSLVAPTADGGRRWLRHPDNAQEQLLHFIFHLRLTMYALAKEPIGKKTTPSSTTVGQMLSQLPRRAAFVRSAETVGVLYTYDTPARLTGAALKARIWEILKQTRTKYAHPRAEVERSFAQSNANNQQGPMPANSVPNTNNIAPGVPISRWEEI